MLNNITPDVMNPKPKGTTKANGRKEKNDKFYTNPEIAKLCLSHLDLSDYSVKIEPSAGSGSFSNLVPDCIAYDIEPEAEGIIQQDWLAYNRKRVTDNKTLVFGNPPFGVQNNLAIKFINHSANFADTIAFILPRSFRKESLINKLNPHLFLREEILLPKDSFLLHGEKYSLPAVFQIWDYQEHKERPLKATETPLGFVYTKKEDNPNLSIQRVGGRAGTASEDWQGKSVQSNYFVSLENPTLANKLVHELNAHHFESRDDAVGPRSISKAELTPVINRIINT